MRLVLVSLIYFDDVIVQRVSVRDFPSPLACYFSVKLPEGGVGNLPVVKGRAYERPEADVIIMVTLQQGGIIHCILDMPEIL